MTFAVFPDLKRAPAFLAGGGFGKTMTGQCTAVDDSLAGTGRAK